MYHPESNGFIKRASNGLIIGYSTPNLHTIIPIGRQMSAEDEFHDASETVIYSRSTNLLDTMAETHITMNLFLNNNFALAEERMEVLANHSMYHALGHGSILFIKAMMTCDKSDLERAIEATANGTKVIDRFRAKYSIFDSVNRLGGQYKVLTDHEIHSELCYAELLLFRAILTFFYDETLASFIRGALRIRSCFQSFKECQRILNCHSWEDRDPGIKAEFEAGSRTAMGVFNLMMSTLPARVLRLLEVIGFSGNKAVGMQELIHAASIPNTFRTVMAGLTLVCWNLFITYFIGAGQPDLPLCKRLLTPLIRDYPNGAIILFVRARYHLVNGNLDNAIHFYNKSINSQNFYKQFHHICYWELLFAHSYKMKWARAANYAKHLLDENKWSKCVYSYLLAILINADLSAPNRIDTVKLLMERVPSTRLRIAGKSIPVEKFCERKAKRFLENNRLYYPHYEFMYFWNGFSILESHPEIFVTPMLKDIETYWNKFPSDDINDICIYEFIRGVCLKVLRKFKHAESCFKRVVSYERDITDYFYLVPNSVFEMAQIKMETNKPKEAHVYLLKARSYQKYSLENKLHFRIHGALETLAANGFIQMSR